MTEQLTMISDAIEKCSVDNISMEEIHNALEPIAEKYSIAMIKAELHTEPAVRKTIFRNSDIVPDENPFCYKTKVDGFDTIMCCFTEKGRTYNESERDFLLLLCKVISCILIKKVYADISQKLYYHDYTTGLPNSKAVRKFGKSLKASGKLDAYSALLLNIKSTNYLNKKVGYSAVTEIIKKYVSMIQKKLETDEIVARINEDIFFLLVKKEKVSLILEIADGESVDCMIDGKSYTFNIQSRVGIYNLCEPVPDFDHIFNSLTTAMNYARNVSHKDIVTCSDELEHHIVKVMGYTQLFRESLDKGDFFVMFQPKVLTTDNTLYGAEALVRWEQDGEIIMPSSFIGTLEREHLVCRLDWFVLEHTCKCISKWIEQGLMPVRISVNFSNDHLLEQNIAEKICKIVDDYKVPHEYIEIEITETVDSEDISKLFEFVSNLRKMKFHVAIDDFGIGYSSLHLLNSVTVDVLKIDKAFVNKITDKENEKERIIIKNIINMAIQLGIEVVAEGVETQPQIDALKELSCYRIQGFIFDKPLSEEKFTHRLAKKKY